MGYHDLFSFYRSKEWETLRINLRLSRVDKNGDVICTHCGKPIVHQYDCIAHHVVELTEENVHDVTISLNPDNIQLLHHSCHNKVHERFGYQSPTFKKIMIVWGSPCSGKSQFVRDNMGPNDLVIDIDRLYGALSTDTNRSAVISNVMAVYRSLIDMVRTRNGRWRTVWIVRTLPLNIDRERLIADAGGGELIHIDTPKDVCLAEAKSRGGDWVKWVEDYWSWYQPPVDTIPPTP